MALLHRLQAPAAQLLVRARLLPWQTLLLAPVLIALTILCCLILAHLLLVLEPLALLLLHLLTHILGVSFKLLPVGILKLRVRIRCSLPAAVVGVLEVFRGVPRTRARRSPKAPARRSRGVG